MDNLGHFSVNISTIVPTIERVKMVGKVNPPTTEKVLVFFLLKIYEYLKYY